MPAECTHLFVIHSTAHSTAHGQYSNVNACRMCTVLCCDAQGLAASGQLSAQDVVLRLLAGLPLASADSFLVVRDQVQPPLSSQAAAAAQAQAQEQAQEQAQAQARAHAQAQASQVHHTQASASSSGPAMESATGAGRQPDQPTSGPAAEKCIPHAARQQLLWELRQTPFFQVGVCVCVCMCASVWRTSNISCFTLNVPVQKLGTVPL